MGNSQNNNHNNHNHNKYYNHHFENRDRYRYSSNQNRSYYHRSSVPHYSKPPFHRQPYLETHHHPYQSVASQQDRPHQSAAPQRDHSYQSTAQQERVPPVTTTAPAALAPILPSEWACAKDSEGRVYYYHELTRVTQWEFPVTEDPAKKQEVAMSGQPSLDNRVDTRAVVHSSTEEYFRGSEYSAGYPEYPGSEMRGPDHVPLRGDHAGQVPGAIWNGVDEGFRPQAKPLNERDLKAAISSTVIKTMTKYRIKLESSDAFKRQARKITHLVADKEMRTLPFLNGQLIGLNEEMKEKIRRFTRDYLVKTLKKQEEQYCLEQDRRSTVDALVNGVANGGSHITITGVPSTPASSSGSVSSSSTQREFGVGPGHARYPLYGQQGFRLKYVGYEDVDVDDEDDIVYGRDSDNDGHDHDEGDEGLSTIPKRRDHHHMGHYEDTDVAAVPSSSVEP
ncbi:hypothetical protein BGZ82_002395 [Podila clonocystis]|nr:hypothetical protein BGZ82_002395 [Podila clonocystis]